MLTPTQIRQITALMHREVVPATGCTEPAAVALAVAYAAAQTTAEPRSIEVLLSGNMLKNAMGVGIPGTGDLRYPHRDRSRCYLSSTREAAGAPRHLY